MNERRDKQRGDGWLFRQPHSRFWWMGYHMDGKQVRQSTGTSDRARAERKLQKTLEDVRRGEATPHEQRITLKDLYAMLQTNYQVNRRRSLTTVRYPFKHLLDFFGEHTKAVRITTDRLEKYVEARQMEGGGSGRPGPSCGEIMTARKAHSGSARSTARTSTRGCYPSRVRRSDRRAASEGPPA